MIRVSTISRFAGILLLVMSAEASLCAPVDKESQAVEKAMAFFKSVGWNVDGKAEAKFRASPGRPKRWDVRMVDVRAEVDRDTGQIRSAHRHRLLGQRRQLVVNITKDAADRLASKYLKAAGLKVEDTRLEKCEPYSITEEPGDSQLHMKYRRVYKGYPFSADGIVVDLDPLDGSLFGFGDSRDSPLPASVRVNLSKQQAADKGRAYLAEFALKAGSLTKAELMIVQPDDAYEYWEAESFPSDLTTSRLAWLLHFDAPWDDTIVCVDAENGSILGGGMTRTPPKQKVVLPALVGIDTITVMSADGAKGDVRVSGSSAEGQALISAIHSLRRSALLEEQIPATLTLASKKRTYVFGYSASLHRLVLLDKKYYDKTIKPNMAWETTKEFEDLIGKYIGS